MEEQAKSRQGGSSAGAPAFGKDKVALFAYLQGESEAFWLPFGGLSRCGEWGKCPSLIQIGGGEVCFKYLDDSVTIFFFILFKFGDNLIETSKTTSNFLLFLEEHP